MKKLLVALVVLLMSVPAFAFEVYKTDDMKFDFYGSIRVTGAYQSKNIDDNGVKTDSISIPFAMQGNSRYGFKFQISKLSGTVELSTSTETGNTDTGRYRLLFATYAFDNGLKLTAGKMALQSGTDSNNDIWDGDNDLGGYGALGTNRRSGVKFGMGGLSVSLISMDSTNSTIKGNRNFVVPRIEVAYSISALKVFANVIIASTDLTNSAGAVTEKDVTVVPFLVGANFEPSFGSFSFAVNGFVGTGLEMFGNGANAVATTFTTNDVKFATTWGASIIPSYKFSNALKAQVGFGYQMSDGENDVETTAWGVYGQVVYSFNKYVNITPQVGYYEVENKTATTKTTDTLFVGVQARLQW